MVAINKDLDRYASEHTTSDSAEAAEIYSETLTRFDYPQMLSGQPVARLLQLLISLSGAKKVLEIGLFTGYSALSMAEALPEGGKVTSIEGREDLASEARKFLDKSAAGKQVEILVGEALTILPQLEGPYDFIFLDANKRMYPEFYPLCLNLLKKGGLLVMDNMLWWGKVLDPKDQDSTVLDRLNKEITQNPAVENILLTVRDGVQIIRKK